MWISKVCGCVTPCEIQFAMELELQPGWLFLCTEKMAWVDSKSPEDNVHRGRHHPQKKLGPITLLYFAWQTNKTINQLYIDLVCRLYGDFSYSKYLNTTKEKHTNQQNR